MKRNLWDELQDAELAELTIKGLTLEEIGKIMGRTPMAISVRKGRLGIRHEAPEYEITSPNERVYSTSF